MNYENYYNSRVIFNGFSFDDVFDDENPEGVQIYYDMITKVITHLICQRTAQSSLNQHTDVI